MPAVGVARRRPISTRWRPPSAPLHGLYGTAAISGCPPSASSWCARVSRRGHLPSADRPPPGRPIPESPEACAAEILRGWFECSGPLRASELAATWPCRANWWTRRWRNWKPRARFCAANSRPAAASWNGATGACWRAFIGSPSAACAAKSSRSPRRSSTHFCAAGSTWKPGTQLHGVDGTLQIIRQMQGSEFAAAAWESESAAARVARYNPEYLDDLCLAGEVTWGRLSPHPAFEREPEENGRRVRPTRVAPLAIFLREDAPGCWPRRSLRPPSRSRIRRARCWPRSNRTARRSSPISRAPPAGWRAKWRTAVGTGGAGLVTADGFENLRALLDPKRRAGQGNASGKRPRHAPGRWALLRHTGTPPDGNAELFCPPASAALGRIVPRSGVPRDPRAALARSAGVAAAHGSARRDPRRQVRRRVFGRAVRAAGGAWRRPIRKQVTQVGVAFTAQHLGALHEEASVGFRADIGFRRRGGKAGPAGARVEFVSGEKEVGSAAGAPIHACLVIVPIAARKGAFGSFLASHRILLRRQLTLPFGVGLDDFLHSNSLPLLSIGEHHERNPVSSATCSRIRQPPFGPLRNRDQPGESERHDQEHPPRNPVRLMLLQRFHLP
jgi:hypothetical protein